MQLDHITLRTRYLSETRDFFLKVFELEEHPRPKMLQHIPGHWLYANDQPIVHLIGSAGFGQGRESEAFDHVGFRLEGYKEFRNKLDHLDIHYSLMDLPELSERRIFFHIPRGPLLEAVFTEPMPFNKEEIS